MLTSPDTYERHNQDNAYSYVINNPLSLVDPTGFFFEDFEKVMMVVMIVAFVVATGGWASGIVGAGFWGAVFGGVVGGFVGGFLGTHMSGGSFQESLDAGFTGALIGGASAGAFNYVGTAMKGYSAAKVVAHGVVGGVKNMLSGGRFEQGFYSAAVTQALSPGIDGINPENTGIDPVRTGVAAVAGGTASAVGGGKFLDGAITGAFSRMYNDESHSRNEVQDVEESVKLKDRVKNWLNAQVPRYGNFGGPGWTGGSSGTEGPVDSMDILFKDHDMAYEYGNYYKGDKTLIKGLQVLSPNPKYWTSPPTSVHPYVAANYRTLALLYFQTKYFLIYSHGGAVSVD